MAARGIASRLLQLLLLAFLVAVHAGCVTLLGAWARRSTTPADTLLPLCAA
jgi:hypothetical protein